MALWKGHFSCLELVLLGPREDSSDTSAPHHAAGVGMWDSTKGSPGFLILGLLVPGHQDLSTNQEPASGARRLGTIMISVMRKHDPAQSHHRLRRTRRPTRRPGAVCPRLQGENSGPTSTLQHQVDGHYDGEQMYGVV